jgi:Domain of unknown function (DUF397)
MANPEVVDISGAHWYASEIAGDGPGRVEVADLKSHVAVRDSDHPGGPVLIFTAFEWDCFLDGVAKGEFDRRSFSC